MIYELIFTSVQKGLAPGSTGFTTVAHTHQMPHKLQKVCEGLSRYPFLYDITSDQYHMNPIVFSHYHFTTEQNNFTILSRIAATQADYSGRNNFLAHHIVIINHDYHFLGPAGFASTVKFTTNWDSPARYLEKNRLCPEDKKTTQFFADLWEKFYGDPSPAGMLAQHAINQSGIPAFIIFEPGVDTLALCREAEQLIPFNLRWKITFNTYFNNLPLNTTCLWRFIPAQKANVDLFQRYPTALIIDLVHKKLTNPLPHNDLVKSACTNTPPKWMELKTTPKKPDIKVNENFDEHWVSPIRPRKIKSRYIKPKIKNLPIKVLWIIVCIVCAFICMLIGKWMLQKSPSHTQQLSRPPLQQQATPKKSPKINKQTSIIGKPLPSETVRTFLVEKRKGRTYIPREIPIDNVSIRIISKTGPLVASKLMKPSSNLIDMGGNPEWTIIDDRHTEIIKIHPHLKKQLQILNTDLAAITFTGIQNQIKDILLLQPTPLNSQQINLIHECAIQLDIKSFKPLLSNYKTTTLLLSLKLASHLLNGMSEKIFVPFTRREDNLIVELTMATRQKLIVPIKKRLKQLNQDYIHKKEQHLMTALAYPSTDGLHKNKSSTQSELDQMNIQMNELQNVSLDVIQCHQDMLSNIELHLYHNENLKAPLIIWGQNKQ